jgi:hypothetical protein
MRSQVAQVLLTLPYSFSQMGMVSGVLLQVFYGLMGSWTAYLISVLYVEYRTRKERQGVSFKNHVIQVRHSPRPPPCSVLHLRYSRFPLFRWLPGARTVSVPRSVCCFSTGGGAPGIGSARRNGSRRNPDHAIHAVWRGREF